MALTGTDPDILDDDGNTPAMLAAHRGAFETLAVLLPLTDPSISNKNGETLLSLAQWSQSPECVETVTALIHQKALAASVRLPPSRPTMSV